MTNSAPPAIFDRNRYARRRARAANNLSAHDFLHRRAMADIVSRLESVTRAFPTALFYGAGDLVSLLTPDCGVERAIHADMTPLRLAGRAPALVYDEERAPLAPASFDLIVSILTLHHANDIIGALTQMRIALKPDGLMLAVLFGEETLGQLRQALYASEAQTAGGVSPRIAPFASVRDLGGALQRAGFALPVADVDKVEVVYRDPMRLLHDLRGMGESSVLIDKGRGLRRDALALALAQLAAGPPVRFDLVTLTGWAPHESQPKPLKPGSAAQSMASAISKL